MNTSLQKLGFESLSTLDGGSVDKQFEAALKRASLDCQQRPGESRARTITLKVTVVPVVDQSGFCEDVEWDAVVFDKIPSYKSSKFSASLRRDGSFVFTDDSLVDPKQGKLDYGDPGDDDDWRNS